MTDVYKQMTEQNILMTMEVVSDENRRIYIFLHIMSHMAIEVIIYPKIIENIL